MFSSDKNQNYTRKAMTELNDRETRAELFQDYHKEENFEEMRMNALGMCKKNNHVKLDIPTSQVDDPIRFGLGGGSCCAEETPVEVEPVPTKPKNRRKQKKPSRREPSIKDAGPRPAQIQTNRGKLEAGDGQSEADELALSVEKPRDYGTMAIAEPIVEKDERKPKKRTIKQFKEEKERERQSVNIRPQFLAATQATEPKPKEKKLLQREEARNRELAREKYQIPDWVEEEDKKEKTKRQAQGNKGKAKKGKKKDQGKQAAKQEKQEKPQSAKKENSVETNSFSDTSEHSQQTLKAEIVKSERRKSHELIDERSLLYDDDNWATIGVSKPPRSERRSVPSDSRAQEPKRSPPARSPPNSQQPRFPLQNNRLTSIETQKQEALSRPARQKTPDIKVNSTQDWPGLPPSNKGDAPKLFVDFRPPMAHRPGTRYEQRQASKAARASAQAAAAEAAKDAVAERARAARIEAERAEATRIELAKLEAAQAETARIEAEKAEAMRRQAEQARIQAEEARIKAAQAEAARTEAARAETARIKAVKEAAEAARLESERAAAVKADALRSSVSSPRATLPPSKAPPARKGKLRHERNQEPEKSTESDIMENILGDQMGLNFFTTPCEDLQDEEKEFPVFSNAQAEEDSWADDPLTPEERTSSTNEMRLDSEQIRQMLLKFNAKARPYPTITQSQEKIVQFHNKSNQLSLHSGVIPSFRIPEAFSKAQKRLPKDCDLLFLTSNYCIQNHNDWAIPCYQLHL